jgi:multiple sugar transport system permease protein
MRNKWIAYSFLAPFMALFLVFYLAPVLYSAYLSLFIKKHVSPFSPPKEVFGGLANYARAFTDSAFLQSLLNIAEFAVVQIPIMLLLALVLALLLDQRRGPPARFFRAAFYLPYTIPSVIAGLLWGFLYSRNLSPFNRLLELLGFHPVEFLAPNLVLWSIGVIVTWTWTGYNMIVMYAALQNVPGELYEAARIDGASGWQLTRYIKLPLLRPTLVLTLIFSIIGTSQIFSEPYVLRSISYVPDNITPNLYLYITAAQYADYAYAGALAIILALITFILSGAFLRNVAFRGEA